MDDGEGREHGPTGPSTNANPPDIPPERQGGPEQSGCPGKETGPQARTKLTRAGIQTAGKTADRPHNGTAGVSSRVTSVAGADGFSVKPTTKLEASNRFRFHTAAQRWAAGMEAETPP